MGLGAAAILVVENHPDTAEMVGRMLRDLGHEAEVTESCAQARAAAEAGAFDLLLCDIHLPDGDGCDLMKELRDRYGLKGVAMSARVYPADRERCLAAGFSLFLPKPFGMKELREAVAAALRP